MICNLHERRNTLRCSDCRQTRKISGMLQSFFMVTIIILLVIEKIAQVQCRTAQVRKKIAQVQCRTAQVRKKIAQVQCRTAQVRKKTTQVHQRTAPTKRKSLR